MKSKLPRINFTCLLAIATLAVAPAALALDPSPGGGYPNNVTALGEDALFSLGTGGMGQHGVRLPGAVLRHRWPPEYGRG